MWNHGNTIGVMEREDDLLTLIEAATVSGYTAERLRQLADRKKLPAKKYGNQWLVERGALTRFLAGYQPTTGRPRGSKNRPAPSQ